MQSENLAIRHRFDWSDWYPMTPPDEINPPAEEGIYRISHAERSGLEYIGVAVQSGATDHTLETEIGDIASEINKEGPPFNAPYRANDHLNTLYSLGQIKHRYGDEFLVSWATEPQIQTDNLGGVVQGYISTYRAIVGESPTANFGISTRNPDEIRGQYRKIGDHSVGLNPPSWENWGRVTSSNWMGYYWSDPCAVFDEFIDFFPKDQGVFRMWEEDSETLLRVGTTTDLRDTLHTIFRREDDLRKESLQVSFLQNEFRDPWERREMEVDLLGAHFIATSVSPQSYLDTIALTEQEIKRMVKQGESKEIEFKRELPSHKEDLAKDCCGLANSKGGYVFVGVSDNGKIVGVDEPRRMEERIGQILTGNISGLEFDTYRKDVDESEIIVISIPELDEDRLYSVNGTFYKRRSTNAVHMDSQEIKRFYEA